MWRWRTDGATSQEIIFRRFIGGRFARPPAIRPLRSLRSGLSGLSIAVLAVLAIAGASHADPKRDVPDYDGRGNPDAEAGSWVLWIPRIVLSPLYVASEYVLRRPLAAVAVHAERERWSDSVAHLFTFGEGGRSKVVPIAAFDLGRLPGVGLDYSRAALVAAHNSLELRFTTWGPRSVDAALADRYAIDRPDTVQARLALVRSEDVPFLGVGPDVTSATRSRYGVERIEGGAGYRRALGAESGVRWTGFLRGACCGDPSLDTRIAHGELMAPPGYRDDYTAAYGRVDLRLDARSPDDPAGGAYLDARAAPSVDLRGERSWIDYGGVAGGAIDLTGCHRVLRAELALELVDPMSGGAVPFTEYAVLGGERMPGFVPGWLTGRSAVAGQLGYSWPVWLGLNAQTRVALGNTFDQRLDGFSPRKLRLSGDVAFMTSTARDRGFELLLGVGTQTFEQGAAITSVRVMLGSKQGL
jgi:hypothetical protein